MSEILTGSICLTDIPRDVIKRVTCRDGKERCYLNIAVVPRREPQSFTNGGRTRTYTHFISCAPVPDKRVEGVNYFIGDLETRSASQPTATAQQTATQTAQPSSDPDLPF